MPDFPPPVPTQETAAFWQGCKEGKLLLQRCRDCTTFRYPPRPMCPSCGSLESDWTPASGRGVVYSYSVTHQALHPSLVDRLPHVVVLVELEEGVRLTSTIMDCAPDRLSMGMPVEVVFHRVSEDLTLPHFKPAPAR